MARIRTVKPEFWGHRKTAKVGREARLLFLGLLNLADDEGRLLASLKAIDGAIYVHDEDVTSEDITSWLKELEVAGFITLYERDRIRYCQVEGFGKHQKVSHPSPSRLPGPPVGKPPEPLAKDSGAPPEVLVPEVEQGTGNGNREHPVVPPKASSEFALVEQPDRKGSVQRVFDEWIAATNRTGRTQLDAKRRRLIEKALKAYPYEDVVDALHGWKRSKWHRGENPNGTIYNDLDLLLRDAKHIEAFRDLKRHPAGEPVSERLRGIVNWLRQESA